jgi:hypothetical protein
VKTASSIVAGINISVAFDELAVEELAAELAVVPVVGSLLSGLLPPTGGLSPVPPVPPEPGGGIGAGAIGAGPAPATPPPFAPPEPAIGKGATIIVEPLVVTVSGAVIVEPGGNVIVIEVPSVAVTTWMLDVDELGLLPPFPISLKQGDAFGETLHAGMET